ncbi:hypothetical protein GCM10027053_46680 [Intrasporangium mesophilum]
MGQRKGLAYPQRAGVSSRVKKRSSNDLYASRTGSPAKERDEYGPCAARRQGPGHPPGVARRNSERPNRPQPGPTSRMPHPLPEPETCPPLCGRVSARSHASRDAWDRVVLL